MVLSSMYIRGLISFLCESFPKRLYNTTCLLTFYDPFVVLKVHTTRRISLSSACQVFASRIQNSCPIGNFQNYYISSDTRKKKKQKLKYRMYLRIKLLCYAHRSHCFSQRPCLDQIAQHNQQDYGRVWLKRFIVEMQPQTIKFFGCW